jgi:hypothetical protein
MQETLKYFHAALRSNLLRLIPLGAGHSRAPGIAGIHPAVGLTAGGKSNVR